ncbi:MAG TPA: hypothetical protein DEA08_35270 [Planctomycetes bacterium]|nr:hypothetical protein [Planctomycetota bacterium]
MPWTHCDQEILDNEPCPSCGLSKSEWTIQAEATRTFRVKRSGRVKKARDAWIELELCGAGGEPVAEAAYRVGLPNGRVKRGSLDAAGKARLEKLPAGTCQVSFPDHLPEHQERETNALHRFELPKLPEFVYSC